jgi:hypothetical protein
MRDVLPLWIILDAVIEVGRPDRKRKDTLVAQTALTIRVRVSLRDSVANLALNTAPLLLGRFLFHPPVHDKEAAGETPARSIHLRLSSASDRSDASPVPVLFLRDARRSPARNTRAGATGKRGAFPRALAALNAPRLNRA